MKTGRNLTLLHICFMCKKKINRGKDESVQRAFTRKCAEFKSNASVLFFPQCTAARCFRRLKQQLRLPVFVCVCWFFVFVFVGGGSGVMVYFMTPIQYFSPRKLQALFSEEKRKARCDTFVLYQAYNISHRL